MQRSLAEGPGNSYSRSSLAAAAISQREINLLREAAGGRLLAVGRVDAVSPDQSQIYALGQVFQVLANPPAQTLLHRIEPGDPVALLGELTVDGYFVESGLRLAGQYVAGASLVYLRGVVSNSNEPSGQILVGELSVSITGGRIGAAGFSPGTNEVIEIVGTQPALGGLVLVESISSTNASVGTGKTDASVGTGKTDASVGTGKTDASVGTGKTDASVGTGKTDASVGTGKTVASVGTGKTDASVGTGKTDASVGTGKTDASVGTG
jgi:hypothetical protein